MIENKKIKRGRLGEGSRHRFRILVIVSLVALSLFTACTKAGSTKTLDAFSTWEEVVAEGEGKEVTILMWGGNEAVNQYIDHYVSESVKERYNIELKRVPMDPSTYLRKLINEKKSGEYQGTADLIWINAENFLIAKEAGLLSGPFTHLLPNMNKYYDLEAMDLNYDSGVPIEGYEAVWGRAQLVFTYDEASLQNPPRSYKELLEWAKLNPGKFTYPRVPEDFVGTVFVRNAFYELTGEYEIFQQEMSREQFEELAEVVTQYFEELNPYLWNQGRSYPATQAQLDELFKNGEIEITMGFEVGKTQGLVASQVYPETVKSYVFDTGTIGNAHYLAIPFNATEQAAALLVIDFLQSPEAQIEKAKSDVWGDMPAFDLDLLESEQQDSIKSVEVIEQNELMEKRLPEMRAEYIEWIKEIWMEEFR